MSEKNSVNKQENLPDLLREGGPKAHIKKDLERALSSYAALQGIKVGSIEWKSINLKLLLPSLKKVSSNWKLIQPNDINTNS